MNLLRFIATHTNGQCLRFLLTKVVLLVRDVANFSDLVLKMSLAVVGSTVTIRVTSSQILRSRVPEDVETD